MDKKWIWTVLLFVAMLPVGAQNKDWKPRKQLERENAQLRERIDNLQNLQAFFLNFAQRQFSHGVKSGFADAKLGKYIYICI